MTKRKDDEPGDYDVEAMLERVLKGDLKTMDEVWLPYVLDVLTEPDGELAEAIYLLQAVRLRYRKALKIRSRRATTKKEILRSLELRKLGHDEGWIDRVQNKRRRYYAEPRGAYA